MLAQSTGVNQVFLNGQTTITGCNTIDFGTVANNNMTFYYTLSNAGQPAGTLYVKFQYSSSTNATNVVQQSIQSTNWNNGTAQSTIACSLSASQIQVTGSTIYLEFVSTSGVITTGTCIFPLKKTPLPSFSFTPTSLSIPCGDTNSRVFTVTPANIPSGANVTYQWSYSGWTEVGSTATSKTLRPSSGTSLPSNVSVTPYINGAPQTTRTCTITRQVFTSPATISGESSICTLGTSATYTINGAGTANTVNWSLSDPTKARISSQNNSQVSVTASTIGTVNLIATITNSCGEINTKIKTITSGITSNFTESKRSLCNSPIWRITSSNTLQPVSQWKIMYNGITEWRPGSALILETDYFNLFEGESVIVIYQAQTSCGLTPQKQITVRKPTIPECKGSPIGRIDPTEPKVYPNVSSDLLTFGIAKQSKEKFSSIDIYPNPVKDKIFINLKDFNNNKSQVEETLIEIFDIQGKKVKNITETNNNFSIDTQDLNKGIYILKIQIKDTLETHKIIVE